MRLYDAARNQTRGSFSQQSPILDATFQEDSAVFLGSFDGQVMRCDPGCTASLSARGGALPCSTPWQHHTHCISGPKQGSCEGPQPRPFPILRAQLRMLCQIDNCSAIKVADCPSGVLQVPCSTKAGQLKVASIKHCTMPGHSHRRTYCRMFLPGCTGMTSLLGRPRCWGSTIPT